MSAAKILVVDDEPGIKKSESFSPEHKNVGKAPSFLDSPSTLAF